MANVKVSIHTTDNNPDIDTVARALTSALKHICNGSLKLDGNWKVTTFEPNLAYTKTVIYKVSDQYVKAYVRKWRKTAYFI